MRNYGVGGYGTLQSLLQFQQALERRSPPAIVVLAYASFHEERNTRTWSWRRDTFAYDRFGTMAQPYVRLAPSGELVYLFDDGSYRDLRLLRHSALLYLLDGAWGRLEERTYQSHRVSRRLVAKFDRVARDHGVRLILAGIWRESTATMLRFARRRGIPAVDISVDDQLPENHIRSDGHPSGLATDQYVSGLVQFLRSGHFLEVEGTAPRRFEETIPATIREMPTPR